ncbi:MAG: glycosyltransferase [bacterium]|nr:glycosyltransferase [bacterium]
MLDKKVKKILIFSLAYYPKFVGGAEVAIKEITDRISSKELEFHMVTLQFDSNLPKTEKIGNVIVHRIGFSKPSPTISDLKKFPLFLNKYWFQFMTAFVASRLHRMYHFDGTWAMMAHSCGIPAGIFKTLHPEVKYLLTLQEGDPPEYIERLARPVWSLFKRGFTKADALQCISSFLLVWGKRMGFKGEGIVIPNGVDTKHFSQTLPKNELEGLKQKLGKKEGDVFLVTTSRLVKKNAVDDIIKALIHLPENYKLLILGIGPDEKMLKDLTEKFGVVKRVNFLDEIPNGDVPKYLQVSDVFIRPSLSEGMGNVFIEAMATGVPVIATQKGGIADFLFDPELNKDKEPTGRAVKPRDPEGIARQVMSYMNDKGMTKSIVTNAKKMVFDRYDWNLIAKNMKERVFDGVLGS